jgi:hypothetical protein
LIKHTHEAHIAARLAPDDDAVRFIDAAIYTTTEEFWVFDVLAGTEEAALQAANRLNVDPIVFY